jgi:hypothetical protein
MSVGSFVERANRFIACGPNAEDQGILLRDCVADGGAAALEAVQRMAQHMYGGETFNFQVKAPAAFALLAFGEHGLRALRDIAEREATSKNISLCLSNLASAAANAMPFLTFSNDEVLKQAVQQVLEQRGFSEAARAQLREYVLGIVDESDAISAVGTQLSRAGWGEHPGVAAELFGALAARRLTVSPATVRGFRDLISSRPNDESAFHGFFERHPQLLEPSAAEVWSKPDLSGAREPDFVVRRMDDSYLVVEIETPAKPLMTAANQLSAQATQAIAQATAYRSFLLERFPLARSHFPRFSDPDCLVVIGQEAVLSVDQREALRLVETIGAAPACRWLGSTGSTRAPKRCSETSSNPS